MKSDQYKALRQKVGTQEAVAKLLDVAVMTIKRREKKGAEIPREAALALEMLAEKCVAGWVVWGE